jgi:hypothetical protein
LSEGKLYKNVAKVVSENSYRYTHDFVTEKEMAAQILDEAKKEFYAIPKDHAQGYVKWAKKWLGE